ncbi:MAG: winged helix DNA-binding domain-containing protein [Chloroflexi bacterium]|nr:winged helix DNA-binding domain-containing protein [Chloroflexota bacterium]MCI0577677.1 winged helix DNA-binding domain-containing protein [Chloroflexota bacterium]MCI0648059.1 winged helix DNA-binding domain-containing protein [Chloroflexota bacterium]MCI0732166.1 winged helix DNA-binding domain-containing protein [Chloroflexota bacterium]
MAATAIALQRLYQQRLSQNQFATPGEIVAWLGAVQAQDYLGAKWALGLRMQNATDGVIERAFTEGTILRTHVMRPTWHFVTPADIRWMLELTAPRVNAVNAHMYRQLELDDALFLHSNVVIAKALQGGQQLTRAELGSALVEAGIAAEGMRLGYIVHRAELDAVVCSGPRRGKQFTYALLDERAPQARILQRDEALAELTRRYYTGHGPATVRDFVWWSGLTVADAKAGLEMVASDLTHEVIDGQTYWFSTSMPPVAEPSQTAFLLPTYDEFLIGFSSFDKSRAGGRGASKNLVFDSTIVIGGQVVGTWRRTFKQGTAVIELAPFAPLTTAEAEAVTAAAQRYGEFVGMSVVCTYITPG